MRKVIVKLTPKSKMRDKKGNLWWGQNPEAAKENNFRHTKNILVRSDFSKQKRHQTAKHEYIEDGLMKKGMSYKKGHKKALRLERKRLRGIKFIEKR